jgi:hypothetical protein
VNSWNSLSLFSHVWQQHGKLVNGNLIPVNTEKHNINKGKCFSFEKNRKTLSFSFITHIFLTCSNHGLSLFVNNWDAATSASFPFFLTHILQNWQNQTNYKSKQNPYPEDYCESIKAKWPNFPSKKHSLPGFPVPG